LEEIGFRKGWLSLASLQSSSIALSKSNYGKYLLQMVKDLTEIEELC